ncbi:stonin-1-like [Sycon ciliatum]|uniref:stonin-1-like n=1 Tax=Sycon ciliatum TaxID=27933 RepID=UPI0031F5FF21
MSAAGNHLQQQQQQQQKAPLPPNQQWRRSSTNPFASHDTFESPADTPVAVNSTDAFGMAPWQEDDEQQAAADRRRTSSFSAAVGHGIQPLNGFGPGAAVATVATIPVQSTTNTRQPPPGQPQRRETFHAGQAPSRQALLQAAGARDNEFRAGSSAVAAPSSTAQQRYQTAAVPDQFGHLPFNVTTDGSVSTHRPVSVAAAPATSPPRQNQDTLAQQQLDQQQADLLREQEILSFKQEQLRKQEEQLQIHISTLQRNANKRRQQLQQQTAQSTGSSMATPANTTDMFGMADFQPGASLQTSTSPASGGGPLSMDDFGMEQFTPSVAPTNQGTLTRRQRSPEAVGSSGAAVISVDTLPANNIATDSSQPVNQRLANASSGLSRINTQNSTSAANASSHAERQRLPRSPENLFRKLPADGQTWHLMYKPVRDSMVHEGQEKSPKLKWMPALVILHESNIFVHEHNPMNDNRTGGQQQQQGFFETQSLAEITLRHEMAFTTIERRRVDSDSRVRLHTIKLQVHNHEERRSLKNMFAVTHEPIKATVLKLGSYDLLLLESFVSDVLNSIRKLPLQLYQRSRFSKNEIFVDLIDRCIVMMDCYGAMKARTSTVHTMVHGFLTGMPECSMIINDTKMVDHRRRTAKGCVTMPPHTSTIHMTDVQLHPTINKESYTKDLELNFQCMEGVRYEALRFKVGGSLPPPLRVTNLNIELVADIVNTHVRLELQPHAGRVRHAIEKVEWHFPVPGSWHNILVKRVPLFGYRSVKSGDNAVGLRSERSTPHATLEASFGTAKYEPENSAIVWRMDKFPPQAGARVALSCHFQVQPGMTKTDFVNQTAMLRYQVVGSCVSGAQVWGLKITPTPRKPIKKWVRYETDFRYQVDLRPPQQMLASPDD